jgi:hypothetical protein
MGRGAGRVVIGSPFQILVRAMLKAAAAAMAVAARTWLPAVQDVR